MWLAAASGEWLLYFYSVDADADKAIRWWSESSATFLREVIPAQAEGMTKLVSDMGGKLKTENACIYLFIYLFTAGKRSWNK